MPREVQERRAKTSALLGVELGIGDIVSTRKEREQKKRNDIERRRAELDHASVVSHIDDGPPKGCGDSGCIIARSSGQWSRTVYYSPKLQHPVAIDVRDVDATGRLLRRERIQLLHAQQAGGLP